VKVIFLVCKFTFHSDLFHQLQITLWLDLCLQIWLWPDLEIVTLVQLYESVFGGRSSWYFDSSVKTKHH